MQFGLNPLPNTLFYSQALVGLRRKVPTWFEEAIIYQVFADRFAPSPGSDFVKPDDYLAGWTRVQLYLTIE